MKSIFIGASISIVFAIWRLGVSAQTPEKPPSPPVDKVAVAIDKGAKWLASVEGKDGGWGQDGGETSYVRAGERLEASGNDVANTAVAALALLEAGPDYRPQVERAIEFILRKVEASPDSGLSVTDAKGTQIQRKLGPFIDTFLSSFLLAKVDGNFSAAQNARVRAALKKCVAKIEQHQEKDGSWNVGGGWAPVFGTSLASRSLFEAKLKGIPVGERALRGVDDYTIEALYTGSRSASAGIALYQSAQAMEQLSRTEEDRQRNARDIERLRRQLADARFVAGFGSVGGEEFFSYLNIAESLKRVGGDTWKAWRTASIDRFASLQNGDGSWAGSHCITGRVAVTSAAILNLSLNREQ
jgi:hypothetical protein